MAIAIYDFFRQGLADALRATKNPADLGANLAAWEREHVAIAQEFTQRGRMIGNRLQVDGTYVPGAPELTQITMPVGASVVAEARRGRS